MEYNWVPIKRNRPEREGRVYFTCHVTYQEYDAQNLKIYESVDEDVAVSGFYGNKERDFGWHVDYDDWGQCFLPSSYGWYVGFIPVDGYEYTSEEYTSEEYTTNGSRHYRQCKTSIEVTAWFYVPELPEIPKPYRE